VAGTFDQVPGCPRGDASDRKKHEGGHNLLRSIPASLCGYKPWFECAQQRGARKQHTTSRHEGQHPTASVVPAVEVAEDRSGTWASEAERREEWAAMLPFTPAAKGYRAKPWQGVLHNASMPLPRGARGASANSLAPSRGIGGLPMGSRPFAAAHSPTRSAAVGGRTNDTPRVYSTVSVDLDTSTPKPVNAFDGVDEQPEAEMDLGTLMATSATGMTYDDAQLGYTSPKRCKTSQSELLGHAPLDVLERRPMSTYAGTTYTESTVPVADIASCKMSTSGKLGAAPAAGISTVPLVPTDWDQILDDMQSDESASMWADSLWPNSWWQSNN